MIILGLPRQFRNDMALAFGRNYSPTLDDYLAEENLEWLATFLQPYNGTIGADDVDEILRGKGLNEAQRLQKLDELTQLAKLRHKLKLQLAGIREQYVPRRPANENGQAA